MWKSLKAISMCSFVAIWVEKGIAGEFADVVALGQAVRVLRPGRNPQLTVRCAGTHPQAAAVDMLDLAADWIFTRCTQPVAEGRAEIPEIGQGEGHAALGGLKIGVGDGRRTVRDGRLNKG
jgi:hypothetical protein